MVISIPGTNVIAWMDVGVSGESLGIPLETYPENSFRFFWGIFVLEGFPLGFPRWNRRIYVWLLKIFLPPEDTWQNLRVDPVRFSFSQEILPKSAHFELEEFTTCFVFQRKQVIVVIVFILLPCESFLPWMLESLLWLGDKTQGRSYAGWNGFGREYCSLSPTNSMIQLILWAAIGFPYMIRSN